ncbi:MAG: amino acid adenylation domain-containing protein, partial [Minicystis sp.]
MIEDAGATVLLTQPHLRALLPDRGATVIALGTHDPGLLAQSSARPGRRSSPQNLAYVIFTSGSTGRPKGAMIEHRGAVNYLRFALDEYRIAEGQGAPVHSSIAFDLTVTSLFAPLLAGRPVTLLPEEPGVDGLADALRKGRDFSLVKLTPSHLEALSQQLAPEDVPGRVRALIIGGEALLGRHLAFFRAHSPSTRLINEYGPTETVVGCCIYEVPAGPLPSAGVPIGRPIANTRLYVLDQHRVPVPVGVAGELYIGGAQVGRGYWRQPDLTAASFLQDTFSGKEGDRLYKTGDLCRYLPNGDLEYLGRIDHQVKVRGYRIELGEIEAALGRHHKVREAVVLAREDAPGEKRLVAYLVPQSDEPTVDELRSFLGGTLPEYMVPSAFVTLTELPLTENGKVDRKALPAPGGGRPELGLGYEAPRLEAERTLAAIWASLLRVEKVGIHDNFFSLGGDSILSIQIVFRAQKAGLRITSQHIFRFPTVAGLAAVAERIETNVEADGPVEGPVRLTPITSWWVEQGFTDAHHWNQSVFLESREALDPRAIEEAILRLIEHHDALRLRIDLNPLGALQSIATDPGPSPFQRIDLADADEDERREVIRKVTGDVQQSLDLRSGPVIRAVLFHLGPEHPSRLLLAVHHIAVDGVSWRILLDDLWTAYQARLRGEPIALPPRTTSIKRWAALLEGHAQSPEVWAEQTFWLDEKRRRAGRLPVDHPAAENTESSARTVSVALSREHTDALLHVVPSAYNTQINDVLLAALSLALRGWTGNGAVLFDLEGHGREEILPGVDLTRTVGWFTTLFPVVLDLGGETELGVVLKSVKEQLRAIPNRGIGYGLLRYLRDNDTIKQKLAELPQAEIIFNYLGQVGQAMPDAAHLRPARESAGRERSARARRSYLLDVNARVAGGRLSVNVTYGENLHERATIEALVERLLTELRALIAHATTPGVRGYTPSDFRMPASQATLDALAALESGEGVDRGGISDLYPLSSIQQGLLFYSINHPKNDLYFKQLRYTIVGEFHVDLFEKAWQETLLRHSMLRSAFFWEFPEGPIQVVWRRPPFSLETHDLRELPKPAQDEAFQRVLREDRERGFELHNAPLLRLIVVRLRDDNYRIIWSQHHLILDGWSNPILTKEVFNRYHALREGRELSLPAVRPFGDYIEWLGKRDRSKAEAFWRNKLQGFSAPTPLPLPPPLTGAFQLEQGMGSEGGFHDYEERRLMLSEPKTAVLDAFARDHGLTINTLLQGVWALLLSRYSGERDIVFGTIVAGRTTELPGIEETL